MLVRLSTVTDRLRSPQHFCPNLGGTLAKVEVGTIKNCTWKEDTKQECSRKPGRKGALHIYMCFFSSINETMLPILHRNCVFTTFASGDVTRKDRSPSPHPFQWLWNSWWFRWFTSTIINKSDLLKIFETSFLFCFHWKDTCTWKKNIKIKRSRSFWSEKLESTHLFLSPFAIPYITGLLVVNYTAQQNLIMYWFPRLKI